jgi:hypothetical protein
MGGARPPRIRDEIHQVFLTRHGLIGHAPQAPALMAPGCVLRMPGCARWWRPRTRRTRAELDAERELRRRLEPRLAELERRLGMDSTDSGTPSSKERIGAKAARRAHPGGDRVGAARPFVPVLREGHVRGTAGVQLSPPRPVDFRWRRMSPDT